MTGATAGTLAHGCLSCYLDRREDDVARCPRVPERSLTGSSGPGALARNDPRQYDELAGDWWAPHGALAMLDWIAEARAGLVPPAGRAGELLVDLGCGAGLLAPHLAGKGYRHLGVDVTESALRQAAEHGVLAVRGDVLDVPLPTGCAAVVAAGEILEHVTDLPRAVGEACRILAPGGLLVLDTIAATRVARFLAVTVGERLPGGAPPGIHDPALFVDRAVLVAECARHGVELELFGLRPAIARTLAWWARRVDRSRMLPTRSTAVLFQARGRKS